MRKINISILIMFVVSSVFCQDFKFPNGVYLTHEQFKNRTPAFNTELKTIIRSSEEIFWRGGNLFKFESKNDSLKNEYVKNRIYAYVKNDSVYINCKHHGLQNWYALAITFGNFVVLKSAVKSDVAFTAALIGPISSTLVSGNDHLHVLNLRSGKCKELNKAYIKAALKAFPELLVKFEQEKKQNSMVVLVEYINLLNKMTAPISDIPVELK
jgi:hypothetical protein